MSGWQPYDPSWLIELVRERMPDDSGLLEALAACTSATWESPAYAHFVSGPNPNEPGSAWQFDHNVIFEDSPEGFVVLDVLKDGRVGGVEYVDRVRAQQSHQPDAQKSSVRLAGIDAQVMRKDVRHVAQLLRDTAVSTFLWI